MLADLGAEVVKLERPGRGDETRTATRYAGRAQHEDFFYANNRSKKSLALDLKSLRDQAIARELASKADVLVENFAPGTAARLGMGWEALEPLNPCLVYCSISGFGQTGPYRDRLALDSNIQAVSGGMSVTGSAEGGPMKFGAPIADVIAGMFAAYAISTALHGVRRDGKGQHIDISMQDAMIAALGPRMGETLQAGVVPKRLGNENPMRVPASDYSTADGHYVSVMVLNDSHWAPFCRVVGRENWIDDARYLTMASRLAHRDELNGALEKIFAARSGEEWGRRLEAERIPYALVNDYAEALSDPQVAHRGLVHELDHPTSGPIRVVGPPWIMSESESRMTPPPLLGQHTAEVLRSWLNWSDERIERFQSEGTQ
jgi:crotonobetainyl-CoA:carnitine CoA-transferase CaiB-like acyl-CoA transferase